MFAILRLFNRPSPRGQIIGINSGFCKGPRDTAVSKLVMPDGNGCGKGMQGE